MTWKKSGKSKVKKFWEKEESEDKPFWKQSIQVRKYDLNEMCSEFQCQTCGKKWMRTGIHNIGHAELCKSCQTPSKKLWNKKLCNIKWAIHSNFFCLQCGRGWFSFSLMPIRCHRCLKYVLPSDHILVNQSNISDSDHSSIKNTICEYIAKYREFEWWKTSYEPIRYLCEMLHEVQVSPKYEEIKLLYQNHHKIFTPPKEEKEKESEEEEKEEYEEYEEEEKEEEIIYDEEEEKEEEAEEDKYSWMYESVEENFEEIYEKESSLDSWMDDPLNPFLSSKVKSFEDLKVPIEILKGLQALGFNRPSSVQGKTVPVILSTKNNVIAQSQSGTGKTACFAIGVLNMIKAELRLPQVVIVSPTMELAKQNSDVICHIGRFVIGDVSVCETTKGRIFYKPITDQIICGTPGTIKGLIRRRKINTDNVVLLVLDEVVDAILESRTNALRDQTETIKRLLPADIRIFLFSETFEVEDVPGSGGGRENRRFESREDEEKENRIRSFAREFVPDPKVEILIPKRSPKKRHTFSWNKNRKKVDNNNNNNNNTFMKNLLKNNIDNNNNINNFFHSTIGGETDKKNKKKKKKKKKNKSKNSGGEGKWVERRKKRKEKRRIQFVRESRDEKKHWRVYVTSSEQQQQKMRNYKKKQQQQQQPSTTGGDSKKIFCWGIPRSISNIDDIYEFFSQKVDERSISFISYSFEKKTAIVEFEKVSDAVKALSLNGENFVNSRISVKLFQKKKKGNNKYKF